MSIFNKVTKTFQWGQHTVTLETGEIARQASGPVLVIGMAETAVGLGAGVHRALSQTRQDSVYLCIGMAYGFSEIGRAHV